jgi:hypothetical protein
MVLVPVKSFTSKYFGTTIFEYLCQHFSHIQASEWQQRFADQLIYAADGDILNIESHYTPNSHIFYYRFLAQETLCLFSMRFYLKMNIYSWLINPTFLL